MSDQAPATKLNGAIQLAAVVDFSLGGLRVQPSSRRVRAGAREELVEPRVMQALIALAQADGAVVSRDALIDRCWGGRIVGDDAINRCIAKVRGLAEIAEPPGFVIETVSKVGYRLKRARAPLPDPVPIEPAVAISTGDVAAPPGAADAPSPLPTRAGRSIRVAAAIAGAVAMAMLAWVIVTPPAPPADRMTLRIDPFTASGPQTATGLAEAFTQATIERLSQSAIVFVATAVPEANAGAVAPRYRLSGTVQVVGDSAKIAAQLIEQPTGHLLYTVQTQQPAVISHPAIYGATVRLLAGVERHVRDAELARYGGRPRDALDLVLRASAAADGQGPADGAAALALGERALARAPNNVSAQTVMAALLYRDFLESDARRGNAEGQRALALIEHVLDQYPRNLVDRHLYVDLLAALGDLRGARDAAAAALADEPDNPGMQASLSMVLLRLGDVAGSVRVLPHGEGMDDAFPAAQAFAQGRYDDALATMRQSAALSPLDGTGLLFSAAILARLALMPQAHATLARALPALRPELRQVSALRQALFSLPDASWNIFKENLRAAGMPG